MRIWIDISSGTWGDAKNIRIIDEDEVPADLVALFENVPDSLIMEMGKTLGREV